MKKWINTIMWLILITFLILVSYSTLQHRLSTTLLQDIKNYWFGYTIKDTIDQTSQKQKNEDNNTRRSVWLSYIEFEAFTDKSDNNTEETFREFYASVLKNCKKHNINNIIVQVRPFSDALYHSTIFPHSSSIAGTQGNTLDYDPLSIMVEMSHKENIEIEAWVNPYRIQYGTDTKLLSEDNPAKKWIKDTKTQNYILEYDNTLYYNPSIAEVRELIIAGVKEIAENYDVDGIHMDDYFYPTFAKENYKNVFDAANYKQAKIDGSIPKSQSIVKWRKNNVNMLVKGIYDCIQIVNKEKKKEIRFGISPQGNLANLRSKYANYVDIDSWIKKGGYVDYIMPQIYWGFTHKQAPFNEIVDQWIRLTKHSNVELMVGLPLYRLGKAQEANDETASDQKEFENNEIIQKQIDYLTEKGISSYCYFSYQHLDRLN